MRKSHEIASLMDKLWCRLLFNQENEFLRAKDNLTFDLTIGLMF